MYTKHNLFHHSKLGYDVELQNTHTVKFKSPWEVHQVGTLSVLLGLGSTLVGWYCNTISVPFGPLLIHLSPRTANRIRYCTNSGNIPSKFYVPDKLKHFKRLDDEHIKSLYSPSVSTLFPLMQNSVSKKLSKKFIRYLSEGMANLLEGNLEEIKKITHYLLKEQLESKKEVYFCRKKRMAAYKTFQPFVIDHLTWEGTVCSSTPLCLQQQQQQPNPCYKTRTTQIKTLPKYHVPEKFSKEGNKSTPHLKCYTFIEQDIGVSSHRTIKFQHSNFGWNTDWRVVEGFRAAPEVWRRSRNRYILYFTGRSQHLSRPCYQQSSQS